MLDQLNRGAGRISGVEKLEEVDELSAAVGVSDERTDLPGKQVDPGQPEASSHPALGTAAASGIKSSSRLVGSALS